jgi:uncharacterized protein (TIGR03437 family)
MTQISCSSASLSQTNCSTSGALQFIENTSAGTRAGTADSVTYEFDWMPPASDAGNIDFYVDGFSANNDGRTSGDRTYVKTFTLTPSTGGSGGPRPAISQGGVVNGASFAPGITQGSWVTIQGANFAAVSRSWRADEIVDGKLPTQLDGVGVNINGRAAFVNYISPTQINVQAPSDSGLGTVQVEVVNNGAKSDSVVAQLQQFSPAFFLWSGKYAVATRPDFTYVARADLFQGLASAPARPGETIILWGTGFGATAPEMPAGQIVDRSSIRNVAAPPVVRFGGLVADYIGGALSPDFAGLYQIAVRVPDSTPDGDIAVVAESGGVRSPENVFVTVQR